MGYPNHPQYHNLMSKKLEQITNILKVQVSLKEKMPILLVYLRADRNWDISTVKINNPPIGVSMTSDDHYRITAKEPGTYWYVTSWQGQNSIVTLDKAEIICNTVTHDHRDAGKSCFFIAKIS